MPLFIDDAEINLRFCPPVAEALMNIKAELADRRVTPSIALWLMKKYLQPLVPEIHRDVLGRKTKASWTDLHWAYGAMAFRSGQSTGLLTDIALTINLICSFTTDPPRDFPILETVEITYFLQLCDHSNINVRHLRYSYDGAFDVFRACKFCWRQPVPRRFICSSHTAGDKYVSTELETGEKSQSSTQSATSKRNSRQKKPYDQMLNKMMSKEVLEFHRSPVTPQTLLPEKDIWNWIKERRPLVSQLVLVQGKPVTDDLIIDSLLSILHNPDGLTVANQKPLIRANELIRNRPQMIWPMLLRAEAWLVVREELRGRWGGNGIEVKSTITIDRTEIQKFRDKVYGSNDFFFIPTFPIIIGCVGYRSILGETYPGAGFVYEIEKIDPLVPFPRQQRPFVDNENVLIENIQS